MIIKLYIYIIFLIMHTTINYIIIIIKLIMTHTLMHAHTHTLLSYVIIINLIHDTQHIHREDIHTRETHKGHTHTHTHTQNTHTEETHAYTHRGDMHTQETHREEILAHRRHTKDTHTGLVVARTSVVFITKYKQI